ncbi:MAG: metalloenzyme [Anaerolineae bacterium]
MHVLLIFLDGIGLGAADAEINPFAAANTPTLNALAGGRRWLADTPRHDNGRAYFVPTDACLGVPGRPQSATGQASMMTGRNVPREIGEHYGPYPNAPIRSILAEDNLFMRLRIAGKTAARLDAYPPPYLAAIERGKRLRTGLGQAAHEGGVSARTANDLLTGRALSADFTGEGWRSVLGYLDAPLYSPEASGALMVKLAREVNFAMFGTWITDEIGHRGDLARGVAFIERFDQVMAGVLSAWDDSDGVVIVCSDHGNFEDLSIRQHTLNLVPTVIIGRERAQLADQIHALTDLTPAILRYLIG